MAEKKKYNSILISGRKDETLTYSRYIKDEESGESVKETLDKKVNVSDELETHQIKDGAITNEKLAADSVGNGNIQDGSVSNEKLEDGSVTNEKLAENSITKDKVQDKTIGVEKLDNELRQTIAAATGLPEDLVETIQNVDDTLKDHQSQLDEKQSQIDDKQQQITANDEDISLLQTRSTQMEETIKGIAATGGASQATAVTYDNEKSGLTAVNAQAAIDETNTKLSDLSLNKYKKCHISLIGDSISTFKDYIPNNYRTYYPQGKIDSVDKTYWHIVCKTLGASIQNLSYSGSTVTTLRYEDYNFYKRALLVDKNASLIIVALGVNDNGMDDNLGGYDYDKDISEYNESIFTEAYIKGIRTLISNHPIADICLIRMSRANEMIGRAQAIKTIAEHYGVMYFDASECYDGALHPDTDDNDDGSEMKKIANGLLSVLSSQSDNGYLSKLEVIDSKWVI